MLAQDATLIDESRLAMLHRCNAGATILGHGLPAEPGDIHSRQGIEEAAWELVYFARDPNARPRLYFDPHRGLVEERAAV